MNYDFSLSKMYLNISTDDVDHLYAEYPATDLIRDTAVEGIMREVGALERAYDLRLPASFVGTTLCYLCLTKLLFVAQYGKTLELALDRLSFQIDYEEGHGHSHLGYRIKEVVANDIPADNAEAFLLEDWRRFLTDAVISAVETIARVGGVKPEVVWQQYGAITGQLIELSEPYPEALKRSVRYQLGLLADTIRPDVFHTRRNPFQPKLRYVDHPTDPGARWLMKSSCCLSDLREDGVKCYACPKLTPEEREVRRARLLQEQA